MRDVLIAAQIDISHFQKVFAGIYGWFAHLGSILLYITLDILSSSLTIPMALFAPPIHCVHCMIINYIPRMQGKHAQPFTGQTDCFLAILNVCTTSLALRTQPTASHKFSYVKHRIIYIPNVLREIKTWNSGATNSKTMYFHSVYYGVVHNETFVEPTDQPTVATVPPRGRQLAGVTFACLFHAEFYNWNRFSNVG